MSGSVRGHIVISGLLPQQEVRYGFYSTNQLRCGVNEENDVNLGIITNLLVVLLFDLK